MDRIFEAYNGGLGVEFMRKTRERMQWICDQVRGKRILDVGCSQGVLPILLGRAGFEVRGLDVNPDAIEFANAKLKEELPSVQEGVGFLTANFVKSEDLKEVFDTVIFGEVLEHLSRPDVFIEKAFSILKPGGVVVITVPFGINDDPDHRQTFYFARIKELLYPGFELQAVKFFGNWIGFVAIRRVEMEMFKPSDDFKDLFEVEKAVYKQERILRDRVIALQDNAKKTIENVVALKGKITVLSEERAKILEENKKLAKENEKLAEEGKKSIAELTAERAKLVSEKAVLEAEKSKISEENKKLVEELRNEKAWATKHKEEFDQFYKMVEAEKKSLESKLNMESRTALALKKERDRLAKLYKKLSEAKLGRLTLAYWKFKDRKR